MNLVFLFNFKVLSFCCLIKAAGVQNFEPQLIIKKCFKNNRFFHLLPERVKNYEPNPLNFNPRNRYRRDDGINLENYNLMYLHINIKILTNFGNHH